MLSQRVITSGLSLVTLVTVILSGIATARAEFLPHRAVYSLALDRAVKGSEVAAARGKVLIEWRNGCDGWSFQYRSVLEIGYSESRAIRLGVSATTWEASDGRDYRFDVKHSINGKTTDHFTGAARLSEKGGGGKAIYAEPKDRKPLALPEGVLFPLAHSRLMLKASSEALTFPLSFNRNVFDGMDENGVFMTSAFIGKSRKPAAGSAVDELLKHDYWPVAIAYFKNAKPGEAPYYEYNIRLYENGVSDRLMISLQDLLMRGEITQLEFLEKPDCTAN